MRTEIHSWDLCSTMFDRGGEVSAQPVAWLERTLAGFALDMSTAVVYRICHEPAGS